jgi:23S rRNA pseudouridine1911/1915/1917 synthase
VAKTARTAQDAKWIGQIGRQALHAYALGFDHPRTGKHLRFVLGWPDDLEAAAQGLYGDARALPDL